MAAIQTLKQIAEEVLTYLDQAGETSTSRNVVYDTIRRVHAARTTERKWNFMLWAEPQIITTVVGQVHYSLHQEFFRPVWFYNRTAKQFMEQNTEGTILPGVFNSDYNFDTASGTSDFLGLTGSAYKFQFAGVSPVQNQPSSASVLTVSGEAGKQVTVYGDTTDGVASETITVGTPGVLQFTKILGVVKEDGWTQTMTLTSNAGAVTNLKLFATESGRQYKRIKLLATPTAVESLYYMFYRQPSGMPKDNSIPDIPAPFGSLLTYDALIAMAEYNDKLSGSMLTHWRQEQARLESGLIDYDDDVDSINAAENFITYHER